MKDSTQTTQKAAPIRLLIPVEFYRQGGVERVMIALISQFCEEKSVEKIVIILPKKEMIEYFGEILPKSEKIAYEIFSLTPQSWESKLVGIYNKIIHLLSQLKLKQLADILSEKFKHHEKELRLNQLIKKYHCSHCLYILINRLIPLKIKIPLSGIAYDLFWHFSPLTYSDSYREVYDKSLKMWLNQADLIFTISQKTKDDILRIFPNPNFEAKLKAIPLAGYSSHITPQSTPESEIDNRWPIFYFASSFGIYKDHLTLLKAGLKLAQKGLKFKVILIGKETDGFIQGQLRLSQQSSTQEYLDYLQECRQVYQDSQDLIPQYFEGLGYCDYEQVEHCYNTCSCVVVPSKYEGFGLAVSEAIVRGLPVIASDLEVFKEQVDLYECGDRVDFFPLGDVEALAACMEQFILNPKSKLSEAEIKTRFSHWTWENVANQYINLLQSTTGV